MGVLEIMWIFTCHLIIAVGVYIKFLVMDIPPVSPKRKRKIKRMMERTSRRAAKRRLALREHDSSENGLNITNTITTDLSLMSITTDSSAALSVADPRMALPDELIALEALAEWNARPIAHRPPLEKVATFVSQMYLSLPYGTTDNIEISLSPANCEHLYRAFHTIRKEFLFTALHITVTVQSAIVNKAAAVQHYYAPSGDFSNAFDSPIGHDLRTYYGNIFNHVSTIRAAPLPPRAALSVLLCDLAAFLFCHKHNIQLLRSAIMTELLDGYIIYLTKMLVEKSETDLYDVKRQLYEARMLNRFAEYLLQLLEEHTPIHNLVNTKCKKFDLSTHGIKEIAPFCFEADARLVRVAPHTKLYKLAPKYLADIIKDNDVFCTTYNIPYHLFVTRTSPFTSYENLLSLVKPDPDT